MAYRRLTTTRQQLTPTLRTESIHDDTLLQFFAFHRVATANTIRTAFPVIFKYHRKTMLHLNWLANQGWLARFSRNDEYIYCITQDGYRRCRDIPNINLERLPYNYELPTGNHADHELIITKIAVWTMHSIANTDGVQYLADGRFMLGSVTWKDPETGETVRPFADRGPDYWSMDRQLINGRYRYMLRIHEVFEGERSPTRYKQKLQEYEEWAERPEIQRYLIDLYKSHGATDPLPEFQLLCTFASDDWKYTERWKERQTQQQAFMVKPAMQARLWTTTLGAILDAIGEGRSIAQAHWHRGRDFVEHRPRWESAKAGQRTKVVDMLMQQAEPHHLYV